MTDEFELRSRGLVLDHGLTVALLCRRRFGYTVLCRRARRVVIHCGNADGDEAREFRPGSLNLIEGHDQRVVRTEPGVSDPLMMHVPG